MCAKINNLLFSFSLWTSWPTTLKPKFKHKTASSALRIERLDMPDAVRNGTTNIPLHCIYRLDPTRERLYSIKFYKNNVEFFR